MRKDYVPTTATLSSGLSSEMIVKMSNKLTDLVPAGPLTSSLIENYNENQ